MPEILIITYYWPPSGGAAIQRWLTFSNKLQKKGFTPLVLTVDENYATFPVLDPSLEKEVSQEIQVYKTPTTEPFSFYKKSIGKGKVPGAGFANEGEPNLLQKMARFIRGNFFIPDARITWNFYLIPKALTLIKEKNIPLVVTAGPPHSTHLAGLRLKKKTGVKWIADFHDAWSGIWYYAKLYKTKPAKALDLSLEKKVLQKADAVLTVGELLKNELESRLTVRQNDKFHLLPMGYDEELFEDPSSHRSSSSAFIITYTGTIAGNYEPRVVFHALKNLLRKETGFSLKLRFIGAVAQNILRQLENEGLKEITEVIQHVSHKASVQYLLSSNALLLVTPKVNNEEMIIPGKIYEYLAARKPVINISPAKSDASRIIARCEAGKSFARNQQKELEDYLEELIEKWRKGAPLINTGNQSYKSFSREVESDRLKMIIERILDQDPFDK